MTLFRVSDNLTIDYEQFRHEGLRITILARSGAGKSNLSALFVEQALDQSLQVCIVEPIREYYTLKSVYDNIVWVSGDGDLLLSSETPQLYTEILQKGANMILTLEEIEDESEEKRFVARFLESLYQRWKTIRRPLLLVVEETDSYAPQMFTKDDRPSLAVLSKIAKRGRKLGINCIFISQRPADLHKSVWSQSNILFLGGFETTRDLEAIKELSRLLHLNINTAEVGTLKAGEFFAIVRGEAFKIQSYLRRTPHGGETPELKPIPSQVNLTLEGIRKEIEEALRKKREEENMIIKLTREIEQLRRENEELRKQLDTMKVVKEIPIEIKPQLTSTTTSENIQVDKIDFPEAIVKCRYPYATKVYMYLKQKNDYVMLKDIASEIGIGRETLKKIIRYFLKKGLVRVKTIPRYGKRYIIRVRIAR